MDETVFKEESTQRVYQYLKKRQEQGTLDKFEFDPKKLEGTMRECLDCIMRYIIVALLY